VAAGGPELALAVGGITAANELFFAPASGNGTLKDFNWRIIPATAVFALMMDGLSQISPRLATGIAATALVTVLFTRIGNAPAPVENFNKLLGFTPGGNVGKEQSAIKLLGG
jgi:hypothetical protein